MNVVLSAAGLGGKAIRATEEVERLLRMTAWLRECLEVELAAEASLAKDKPAKIGGAVLDKWTQLVTAFDKLSNAMVRLEKAAKQIADDMTPEQEMEAVRAFIRALDPVKRRNFLAKETAYDVKQSTPIASD